MERCAWCKILQFKFSFECTQIYMAEREQNFAFYWVRFCLDSAYLILSLSFKISKNIPGPKIFGVPLYCKLYMCQISF